MATLFKKMTTRKMPPGAVVVTRNVKKSGNNTETQQIAQWVDRKGKKRSAEVIVGKDGSQRIKTEAATWTAKYRDGEGVICEVATGCRDKQAALSVLNDLTTRAELVKAKVMTADQADIADHALVSLETHISDFLGYQRQKGTHPARIEAYKKRLTESAISCRFRSLNDLSVDRLEKWLAEQRDGERDMGASVYNGFREAWIAFGNWCIGKRTVGKQTHFNGEKRLIANPFDGMARLNQQADRRRRARALTEAELTSLLDAARTRPLRDAQLIRRGKNEGKQVAKLTPARQAKLERLGLERSLIYKTLVLTGLRANELRTLECRDLSFGDVPFIRLRHANEKNRKGASLPMRSDLAADLRSWTKDRKPSERVFDVPKGIVRILDRDLVLAGIPKKDADGCVVHIHALRHSFGTHLSLAGVAPRVAQAAMRHSNIALTMGTYTDARLLDTAKAVETLPSLPITPMDQSLVAPTVAPTVVKQGRFESFADVQEGILAESTEGSETKKPRETLGLAGFCEERLMRFELTTTTLATLCSTN